MLRRNAGLASVSMLLALIASPAEAMRTQVSSLVSTAKARNSTAHDVKNGSTSVNLSGATGAVYLAPEAEIGPVDTPGSRVNELSKDSGSAGKDVPEETKKGRCCKRITRNGGKMYRLFYKMADKDDSSPSYVWSCPKYWKKTDLPNCNGMEMHNLIGYKENTDWVMCCKKAETSTLYEQYSGSQCSAGGHILSRFTAKCNSYDCESDHVDVDEDDVKCSDDYEKLVNKPNSFGCKEKVPAGFSDQDCAGYSSKCEDKYCVIYSTKDEDCSSSCPNFDSGAAATAVAPPPPRKRKSAGSGATDSVMYVPLPMKIIFGVVLLVFAGAGAFICTRKDPEAQQGDETAANGAKGMGKGQPQGPFSDGTQSAPFSPTPQYDQYGQMQGAPPPQYGQYPPGQYPPQQQPVVQPWGYFGAQQ